MISHVGSTPSFVVILMTGSAARTCGFSSVEEACCAGAPVSGAADDCAAGTAGAAGVEGTGTSGVLGVGTAGVLGVGAAGVGAAGVSGVGVEGTGTAGADAAAGVGAAAQTDSFPYPGISNTEVKTATAIDTAAALFFLSVISFPFSCKISSLLPYHPRCPDRYPRCLLFSLCRPQ